MSNGRSIDLWKVVLAVLAALGITGTSWLTLNSAVAAQGRDVANACERITRAEERATRAEDRLSAAEREAAETRGDIKEIKAIVKRIEDSQRNRGRVSEP